jgi:hypothetical protein
LFLSLERNEERVLGNITFCRRGKDWYVRYFAFDTNFQSNRPSTPSKGSGGLKTKIGNLFHAAELGEFGDAPERFYAYIDPKNERSLFMSKNFGFKSVARIATQTFSRISPVKGGDVRKLELTDELKTMLNEEFGHRPFYFSHHTFNLSPFYGLFENDVLIGYCKTHRADWVIERLPGKAGGALVKLIPYIPGLRRILKPKSHTFLVIDTVWIKPGYEQKAQMLFESMLFEEQLNLLIWWVDERDTTYNSLRNNVQWGLLHKLNGVNPVDLVVRTKDGVNSFSLDPIYITGVDFI